MPPFRFIVQDGQKAIDWETQSQIKTHVMLNHLRRKASGGMATQNRVTPEPSGVGLDSRTQGHFEVFKVKTRKQTRRNHRKTKNSDQNPQSCVSIEGQSCQSFIPGLTDVAGHCGTYSFDGVPKELSDRIMRALQYHVDSHAINAVNITIPANPIFSQYMIKHFFNSRAAFFSTSLKVLLFDSVAREHPGSQWITQQDLYQLRFTALGSLNEELQKSTQIRDSTICATFCILMFENAIRSNEGLVHLRGLYHIHQLARNDIDQPDVFAMAIRWLDAIGAVVYNTSLSTTAIQPTMHLWKTESSTCSAESSWLSCPLRVVKPFSPPPIGISTDLIHLLGDAFTLVEMLGGNMHMENNSAELRQIRTRLDSFEPNTTMDRQVHLRTACWIAARLHWQALHRRQPYQSIPERSENTYSLWACLKRTKISDWMQLPYVYLWILLTGAASSTTANGTKEDSLAFGKINTFFYSRLCQFLLTLGLQWPDDFNVILMNFVWLQSRLRQG